MQENARLLFSVVWLIASGCLLASAFAVIISWGDYLNFLYASIILWCVASAGTVIASL